MLKAVFLVPVSTLAACALAGMLALSASGANSQSLADEPQPTKAVDLQHLAGRWYEVARVPNLAENDCTFATSEWQPKPDGKFQVTQTCSASATAPPMRIIHATATGLDPATNAKWRMSYFGGLIHRDYWVMDRAPDSAWLILGMPGKHYVWVLARQPDASPAMREQFTRRISALGYDAKRLVFPLTLASRAG